MKFSRFVICAVFTCLLVGSFAQDSIRETQLDSLEGFFAPYPMLIKEGSPEKTVHLALSLNWSGSKTGSEIKVSAPTQYKFGTDCRASTQLPNDSSTVILGTTKTVKSFANIVASCSKDADDNAAVITLNGQMPDVTDTDVAVYGLTFSEGPSTEVATEQNMWNVTYAGVMTSFQGQTWRNFGGWGELPSSIDGKIGSPHDKSACMQPKALDHRSMILTNFWFKCTSSIPANGSFSVVLPSPITFMKDVECDSHHIAASVHICAPSPRSCVKKSVGKSGGSEDLICTVVSMTTINFQTKEMINTGHGINVGVKVHTENKQGPTGSVNLYSCTTATCTMPSSTDYVSSVTYLDKGSTVNDVEISGAFYISLWVAIASCIFYV